MVDHPKMVIDMNETKLDTIAQLQDFLKATPEVSFGGIGEKDGNERYEHIGSVRIFVFEARGVGLIHAVVRLWLTCWPFKAKGTLST